MDQFQYLNGQLFIENMSVEELADKIGTPFYCYSATGLENQYKKFSEAVSGLEADVCYAVKANSNIAVLEILARLGAGADVVSVGELKRAQLAGISAKKIVFSGVGKTNSELKTALIEGVKQINVESEAELRVISDLAFSLGIVANIGIRVNPNVDADTHEKITTGRSENKFGIDLAIARDVFLRGKDLPNINLLSIAVHIGSQLTNLEPYEIAYSRVAKLVKELRTDGLNITNLDLGGGLGINYNQEIIPTPKAYSEMVSKVVEGLNCNIVFEPGRWIVGNSGILVTRVTFMKKGIDRDFCIVDGAMNDLVRPTLYNAYHKISKVSKSKNVNKKILMDIVGPICESGDYFAQNRKMPPLIAGDLLAIHSAGAYGAVMSSFYNSRPIIPEIMVKGKNFSIIRKRITVEDMINWEHFPDWAS